MNKENNTKSKFFILIVVFLIVIFLGIYFTQNIGQSSSERLYSKSVSYLNRYLKNIKVSTSTPSKSNITIGKASLADELPDISQYDLSVKGSGQINIEIFSSPEKAGDGTDGWLKQIAQNFNKAGYTINGKSASVSVRNISSGDAVDYIISGKYIPDAFTPSNELWGAMAQAQSAQLTKITDSLVKNTSGILLSKSTLEKLKSKYGSSDLASVVKATIDNEISLGYTNPYASSTGLNFLISALSYFDSSNPLSDTAKNGFQTFQANIPFVSYNTMQMRSAAESGSLDAFIMEYQTYVNDATLKNKYSFIPFGLPHNNPLYSCGTLSQEKSELIEMFTKYATNSSSQKIATSYGFNNNLNYTSTVSSYDGNTLLQAQQLWKEEKDLGKPIIAVFVSDVSGSMAGTPITKLKESLINGSQYINNNNYIGLVSYSTNVTVNLPIDRFDVNQRAYFNGSVQSLTASGNTATFDAILVATNMLLEKQKEVPDSKLMMFVLSDGETNMGHSLENVSKVVKNLDIPIYTIGYNANISALGEISNINEAASINADSEDVIYQLKNLFNSNL